MYGGNQAFYRGLSGGLDPPSAECPQPVHTNERDALRNQLKELLGYYGQRPFGQHWHEGHPDVRAWLDDLIPRVKGLYDRPKLLRCSAEARKKAREWASTFNWVGSQIRSGGSFQRGGYTSVPGGGLYVRTYNLRDYNFRPGNPAGAGAAKPPPLPVEKEEGVPFDPSVGGAGGDPTKSASPPSSTPTATSGGQPSVAPTAEGGYAPAQTFGTAPLPDSIAGIPSQYLIYGGLALLAWRMVK